MKSWHMLYQMARADFLERTRRYSFLLTMAFALYLGYSAYSGRITMKLGDYTGVQNSAWLGTMMAMVTGTFLSLAGFYIVRNSVSRDEQTRVGRILAATPMTKGFYVVAKAISNFAVLMAMVAVLIVCAFVTQAAKGTAGIRPLDVVLPFVIFTVPVMALTSALAILFETTPLLRGGAGNVAYFFLWTFLVATDITRKLPTLLGINAHMQSMGSVIRRMDPAWQESFSLSAGDKSVATKTFLWDGMAWSRSLLLGRLFWLGVAMTLCVAAAVFFNRFDPAHGKSRELAKKDETESFGGKSTVFPNVHLTPLGDGGQHLRFMPLVAIELKLLLKGLPKWWYAVAAVLAVGPLVCPETAITGFVLVAMIWPVLVWSQLGTRESLHNTGGLLFSCPEPLWRQLPASWTAAVFVTALLTFGYAARLVVMGAWTGLLSWLAMIVFVPSLALALGTISGSKKAFEAIYTGWWYLGPAHQIPGLDFIGLNSKSQSPGLFLLLATVLLVASFVARRSKLAYA